MPKIVFPAALAPSTAGPVVAVSNDYDGWDHYPSEWIMKFQMHTTKFHDEQDFFPSQFDAQPKLNIACEIDKIYLLT